MTTDLFDLTGKIACVTAASRGIGEEIAKLFAEQEAQEINGDVYDLMLFSIARL